MPNTCRILIIDDNPAIFEDFQKIFAESAPSENTLHQLEAKIFGNTDEFKIAPAFELESALQGEIGRQKIQAALAEKRPYSLAFVDMRMPPGWDGVETVEQLWKVDPDLQVVICTAYSDYSWDDMRRRLGDSDSLVVLKKPFDNIEVLQLAHALTRKWELLNESRAKMGNLDELVADRTRELQCANEKLKQEMVDRAKAEENFRQAQKMEAAGWLAAGFAHEFNNVLTVIRIHSDLLLESAGDPNIAKTKQHLADATERGAALTRQLLSFSGKQPFRPKPVEVNRIIAKSVTILSRLLGEHVALRTELAEDLPCALVDESSLEHLLANLAANARDGMPDGGKVTLTTSNVRVDDAAARSRSGIQPGNFLCVALADTGIGFDAATLERIFEPFVVTKPGTSVSGMGLTTVQAIVKQHGGWIEVASKLRIGTTFKIFLPVTHQKEAPPADSVQPSSSEKSPGAGKVVLLVEDDREVRHVAHQVLKQNGCQVIEVGNALEALRLLPQYRGKIDLLLTDVILPHGIDGYELGRRLQAQDSRLRVIYTSGYGSETAAVARAQSDTDFIAKPYSPLMLITAVNACFEKSQPRLSA